MGKITFLARTSLLIIFLLGSSLSFLTAKNTKTVEITISGTVLDVSCSGVNDGSISVNISGGVAPYTFTWTELSQTTETVSNLPVKFLYHHCN
ncbi:SprB repeat-containing protein [Antarcticibacterium sp. 1MA-6-2]|uniref:SprB repeat-containing protein n=1 Tax=Antarcticibacterium sp. 1MA-6-2 TaxID=2908210 RepID=UPI0038FC66CD